MKYCLVFAAAVLTGPARADVPKELGEFLAKEDKSFAWKSKGKIETPTTDVYELAMTSQKWQETTWTHAIQIFVPKAAKPQATMLIYNTGGGPSPQNALFGLAISERVKGPVAFLYGIPNQPIYGKTEDALIAETFTKYLATEDASWPLLFPMAKSLIRAMDALQAFAKEEWKQDVTGFVVSGASKRGWTSWLTAASGDPRVKAIIPMVIDTLNMKAQMPHQLKSFGAYSAQIDDYVKRGLVDPKNADAKEVKNLWAMVDPWSYREKLKLPKVIVCGTNDPYWTQDALNLYWDDLAGPKWILYVPNAGHNLEETRENGKKDRERVLNTISAATRWFVEGKAPPAIAWYQEGFTFTVDGGPDTKSIRLWQADSDSRDFRKAKWTGAEVPQSKNSAKIQFDRPKTGFRAAFAECEYDLDGLKYTLSTQIRILEPAKK